MARVLSHTVNGRVTAAFATAPRHGLEFSTVNGAVDLTFPKDLDSDLTFSTTNGELFTDFQYTVALQGTKRGGSMNIRIGEGGVPIRCQTVNGNITIHAR